MYTQYLFIPLIAVVIYCNLKTAIFTIIATLLFLVDGDQLNIQYIRDISIGILDIRELFFILLL